MTPIDELHAAAEKLKSRVKDASPGPWDSMAHTHMEDGCRCLSCWEASGWVFTHTKTCDETELAQRNREAADCNVDVMSFEDAEYAITVHPGVGAALAELLAAATRLAAAYPEMAHDHDRPACDDYACDVMGAALAVARAILGSQP
ncbi:hypothetical protein [Streptomyces sp. NPDC002467]|uniref:hypothetical protein n=1 Tax=Streptomyces sp. NPDC002467 TaxID=3364647 RepID=UPI0036C3AC70